MYLESMGAGAEGEGERENLKPTPHRAGDPDWPLAKSQDPEIKTWAKIRSPMVTDWTTRALLRHTLNVTFSSRLPLTFPLPCKFSSPTTNFRTYFPVTYCGLHIIPGLIFQCQPSILDCKLFEIKSYIYFANYWHNSWHIIGNHKYLLNELVNDEC